MKCVHDSFINEYYHTVVIATEKLSNSEAKSTCYDNFEGDNNRVVIFFNQHLLRSCLFFRLQVYQTVSIIRLRVYRHSFIATVYLVTVAIKECDKLEVLC